MSRNVVKKAAREITAEIITAARTSGPDPIAWITGNAMMPPLRWFDAAERIWQLPARSDHEPWDSLVWRVEQALEAAHVMLECPPWDNALYAVDVSRFEYILEEDRDPDRDETLQDEWRLIAG